MKTLAIINEKGGVGKSFIATQFALYCRFKLGNRVLVVDLDQQRNTSDILINSGLCVPTEINCRFNHEKRRIGEG